MDESEDEKSSSDREHIKTRKIAKEYFTGLSGKEGGDDADPDCSTPRY